jgi:hypothetical protein
MIRVNMFLLLVGVNLSAIANFYNFQENEDSESLNDSFVSEGKTSYYVEPGTYGTKRETDPPEYVRSFDNLGFKKGKNTNWLDVGLDYRTRFEFRHNDLRRPESYSKDYPFLLRTRAYIGIKNIIDPVRIVFELEDARRVNGNYPLDNRDVNTFELIQGYGEVHFKKAFGTDARGNDRPFFLRGGRQSFEFLDRRLIGLNQWRNTTNNFLGFRAALGQDKNDWQIDLLGLKPITRIIDKFDTPNKDQWFWAAIGHWRKWSDVITIEPYYIALRQRASDANGERFRMIHGTGLRLFGWVGETGLNYEFTGIYQFGKDRVDVKQKAYMVTSEIGYTFTDSKWKPRFSAYFGYVSGDKNPNDKVNNRFERYFGFARPWSSDDYVVPENIITPKIKVEFEPVKGLKIDGGYSFFWIASSTDRFNNLLSGNSFNRDQTGNSGNFLGHGLDARARFNITPYIAANIGYTHFTMGEFVQKRQQTANGEFSKNSDFTYLELTFNVFDIVKEPNRKKNKI